MSLTLFITGSKGLLGTEIRKHLGKPFGNIICTDIDDCDINKVDDIKRNFRKYEPDVVLHLAAYTDLVKAEYEKRACFKVNVDATRELAKRSPNFIYISTEYVFDGERGNYHEGAIPNPVNFYSLTKLLGEYEVRWSQHYTVIRTLFKPRPYKHSQVPTDMWTSGDYVDVIAPMIAKAVKNYQTLPKILNIGTGRKNLYEMALQTKQVQAIKRMNLSLRLPRDTSLDTTVWEMLNL